MNNSQTARNRKYKDSKNIKQMNIDLKPNEIEMINNGKEKYGMGKKEFIVKCCKYCIDNNIDLTDPESKQEDN